MVKGVKVLKILIASMKYGYGDKSQPVSYEWNHFYLGLKDSFSLVEFFDFMEESKAGKEAMQEKLLAKIKEFNPDILILTPYTDQFDTDFVSSLRNYTKTFGFFHDDNWRQDFVKIWAPCFDVFTTTDFKGVEKYRKMGLSTAVYLPFGVNEKLFTQDQNKKRDIDVSFVGAWHPYREWLINKLKKSGVDVKIYGPGWKKYKPLSEREMVEVFQRSKISLNLSNSINYDARYLLSSPRAIINTLRSPKNKQQIKGRHFEIPACGPMQLSYFVQDLEKLFEFGKEIETFNSPEEFVEKVTYYLNYNDKRQAIADAGYQRVLCDHSYVKRFMDIFREQGWINDR